MHIFSAAASPFPLPLLLIRAGAVDTNLYRPGLAGWTAPRLGEPAPGASRKPAHSSLLITQAWPSQLAICGTTKYVQASLASSEALSRRMCHSKFKAEDLDQGRARLPRSGADGLVKESWCSPATSGPYFLHQKPRKTLTATTILSIRQESVLYGRNEKLLLVFLASKWECFEQLRETEILLAGAL